VDEEEEEEEDERGVAAVAEPALLSAPIWHRRMKSARRKASSLRETALIKQIGHRRKGKQNGYISHRNPSSVTGPVGGVHPAV
jgi:hypothetical protein